MMKSDWVEFKFWWNRFREGRESRNATGIRTSKVMKVNSVIF